MLKDIRVTPWKATPDRPPVGRGLYITERMIDAYGPTDDCRKCSTGLGNHSAACRQRFEQIQADLLAEKLRNNPVESEQTLVAPAPAAGSSASAAPDAVSPAQEQQGGGQPAAGSTAPAPEAPGVGSGEAPPPRPMEIDKSTSSGRPAEERPDEQGSAKKPRVAMIGNLAVCELAVCEEGFDEAYDPEWDPHPKLEQRCSGRCSTHASRCQLRMNHKNECACRRCLMAHIGSVVVDAEEQVMEVSAELHEADQWKEKTIHYDYYTGEPLDEDLYQKGRDDELKAMDEHGVLCGSVDGRCEGWEAHWWISYCAHEGGQGPLEVCCHRSTTGIPRRQSSRYTAVDVSPSYIEQGRFGPG